MVTNSENFTAFDFAGTHQSFDTLMSIIDFYKNNFEILEQAFSLNAKGKPDKNVNKSANNGDYNQPWVITRVNKNQLSET